MELSYGEVEELLAHLHDVHESRRMALMGRIKHFQRLGWPGGTNLGKGSRVRYDVRRTLRLVAAFELLQFGLTPERSVASLKRLSGLLPSLFLAANRNRSGHRPRLPQQGEELPLSQLVGDGDVYLVFDPAALRNLSVNPERDLFERGIGVLSSGGGLDMLNNSEFTNARRHALLNISQLLNDFIGHFASGGADDKPALEDGLAKWADEEPMVIRFERGNDQET